MKWKQVYPLGKPEDRFDEIVDDILFVVIVMFGTFMGILAVLGWTMVALALWA